MRVHPHTGVAITFQVLLWLPLVWRRRHPATVFWVVAAVAFGQWVAAVRLPGDAALLVAMYTVAAHETRARAMPAAAALGLGVVLATVSWAPAGGVVPSLVFLSGIVAAAWFLGVNVRTRRAYLASLIDRAERLERDRDQQARLAVAAERTRIAREMHDVVAHSLSVMVTLADAASLTLRTRPDDADAALRQVSSTGRDALAETRRLLGVLRTDVDEPAGPRQPQPGIGRLDELLAPVRATGLPAQLTVTGTPFPVPVSAETAVYRIVQEALTNTLKHAADPTYVGVTLRYDEPRLVVDVRDDGRPRPATDSPGHGLTGMRERAAAFGGGVTAGPVAGGGWRVTADLPVAGEAP